MTLNPPGVVSPHETIRLAAFESAGEAIVVTDSSGRIEYVNPAFEKISGYRRDEVIGQNPRVLKSGRHGPEFYQRLWETITSGNVWKGSFVNRRKDGTIYFSEQTISPVLDSTGQRIGYVSVHEDVSDRLRDEELQHASELRSVREAADERVRLARHELELARAVQNRLFPQASPQIPGFDLAGAVYPAEETCGDYYDFIPMPDGRIGVVLGDVSGHGLGAALIMSETRACLRVLSQSLSDVDEILHRVNQLLVHDLETGRFVSLFFAILDPASRTLVYATAGQPAYHVHTSGQVNRLSNSGMVLGLLDDAEIPRGERMELQRGDLIFVATDGLHETHAADGSMFGMNRTLEVLCSNRHRKAREILEELHQSSCQFRQGTSQQDDVTMVLIKASDEEDPSLESELTGNIEA